MLPLVLYDQTSPQSEPFQSRRGPLKRTHLCAGLSTTVGAHELHKLLERVLVMVVPDGRVGGEVGAGLLDDGGGGEVEGGG